MEHVEGAVPGLSNSIRGGWGVLVRPTDPVRIYIRARVLIGSRAFTALTLQSVLSVRRLFPLRVAVLGWSEGVGRLIANAREAPRKRGSSLECVCVAIVE